MDRIEKSGHGFGTAPVFLAAISTILGAILFLRFGYAVGHTGMLGAIMLILIGHAITIPTGLAVAEIATNLKVEGGGEYFIISRSFGATVGGAIGISLYFSQAISVAFYLIAFSEAFRPLFSLIENHFGIIPDPRMISIPAALLLSVLIVKKGANLGVSALWVVVAILGISLSMFFLGNPTSEAPRQVLLMGTTENPHNFFIVFAIVFPPFSVSENVQIPVSTHRGRHNNLCSINNLAVKHGGMTAVDSTFSDTLLYWNDCRRRSFRRFEKSEKIHPVRDAQCYPGGDGGLYPDSIQAFLQRFTVRIGFRPVCHEPDRAVGTDNSHRIGCRNHFIRDRIDPCRAAYVAGSGR